MGSVNLVKAENRLQNCKCITTNCIRSYTMHVSFAHAVQHLSNILYSFSSLVSSTTLPSVALCLPGFRNMRMAGNMTCSSESSAST